MAAPAGEAPLPTAPVLLRDWFGAIICLTVMALLWAPGTLHNILKRTGMNS